MSLSGPVKYLLAFIVFWLVSLAFYFKTAGAGFSADAIGWVQIYEQTGWQGLFSAFGDKSLHYVYHFLFYGMWKLFGLNGYAWMLVFITLHAAIATVAFNLFSVLFSKENIPYAAAIAFAGSLLFVVSPYLTETLVWYACIHYLTCVLLVLACFRLVLSYMNYPDRKKVVLFYVFYLIALFAIELSFVLPALLLLFFLFWPPAIFNGHKAITLLKIFVLPTFVAVLSYFALSKIFRGSMVGHYGAEAHLNFHIPLLMANLSKYMAKIFLFVPFAKHRYASAAYALFEKEKFGWTLFALLAAVATAFLFFNRKISPAYRMASLLFAFFVVALLPILNLFVTTIVNVESDRFTYFASVFAYPFFVLFFITGFKKFGWVIIALFLFFQVKYLHYNTESWHNSGKINSALTTDFKWADAKQIYLLNMPDNFRGAYLFRGFPPDNSFSITMWIKGKGAFAPRVQEILLYNMNSVEDGVSAEKVSDNELKVTFNQWGNWWWWKGVGAQSYKTERYEVSIDEGGHSYHIRFFEKNPDDVFLYQVGDKWIEVKDF